MIVQITAADMNMRRFFERVSGSLCIHYTAATDVIQPTKLISGGQNAFFYLSFKCR